MLHPDNGALRWLETVARQQRWKVASWHELDDLIQDGIWLFYRVVRKYPFREHVTPNGNVRLVPLERRHIMGLFQRAFLNHITNLANKRTRGNEAPVDVRGDDDAGDTLERLVQDFAGYQPPLEAASVGAPHNVKRVIDLLIEKPEVLSRPYRCRIDGRETKNDRVCRALRLNPNIDRITPTRDYLAGKHTQPGRVLVQKGGRWALFHVDLHQPLAVAIRKLTHARTERGMS